MLAGALATRWVKNIYTMNVEFYTGVDERLDVPSCCRRRRTRRPVATPVLIVDDVADTGHTLELVHDFCAGNVAEVRSAVLYEKPRSVVRCDYVWRRTDRWITSRGAPAARGGRLHRGRLSPVRRRAARA